LLLVTEEMLKLGRETTVTLNEFVSLNSGVPPSATRTVTLAVPT
jgi:hypothetical protein